MYIISGILVFFAIIIAYIVGRVHEIPTIQTCCCELHKYPNCPNCLGKICLSHTELNLREEQAYYRGKYDGKKEEKESKDLFELLDKNCNKFSGCVEIPKKKTIAELEKELGYSILIKK